MMFKIKRMTTVMVCLCCKFMCAAQELEADVFEPEAGVELVSELQVTQTGDYNYVNLLRLSASVPIAERFALEAASLSTCMTADESIGDDLQTFSNLDAGKVAFAVSVCDIAWRVTDRQSLFIGIRNMNEDYFNSPVTSFFTNSSCGIYPTISANYPIANYPLASMGLHYHVETENIGVNASVYNGKGYEKITGRESVFRFRPKDDGVFAVADVRYSRNGGRYYVGSALYSKDGVSISPWVYAEQSISDKISLITGYSHGFGRDITVCRDFVGIGAYCQLEMVEMGVFVDVAHYTEAKEYATEVTCKIAINDKVSLQPSAHVIIDNPTAYGEKTKMQAATTVRLEMSF